MDYTLEYWKIYGMRYLKNKFQCGKIYFRKKSGVPGIGHGFWPEREEQNKGRVLKIYFKLLVSANHFLFLPRATPVLSLKLWTICPWSCILFLMQSLFSFQSSSTYPEGCWFNNRSEYSSLNNIYFNLFLKESFVIPIRNESLILPWHYIWNLPKSSQILSNSEESKVQQTRLM